MYNSIQSNHPEQIMKFPMEQAVDDEKYHMPVLENKKDLTHDDIDLKTTPTHLQKELYLLLKSYPDLIAKNELDIGKTSLMKADLRFDESKLVIQKQRPLIPRKQ